ncbi:MAG: hypothetical protein E6933_04490 [Clostridiales bacterium]|nr:hypothetical protein [Clostridiales bacterium]
MEQEKICGTCKYFAQHYRKWGKGYHEVDCGHCKYPRIKKPAKDQTCPHWAPREG